VKFIGLNGRTYHVDLKKYIVRADDTRAKSKFHMAAREILREQFKGYSVFEEVPLPGSRKPNMQSVLFLDFYIPSFDLGIEVHGQQHYEFCQFFHKTKAGYLASQIRDRVKEEWCEVNDIELTVFNYSDDPSVWRKQLE